ncbi:filamentous hemagglutinin N-terminal domain-containing protein [Candidatus Albibeggiatoa sp. nov. NOAA]|uniref:two-partner secretion domain-containing protein n=1 Tax=Candidatus Albibeggiatoa sp. nov. NOAA TaxID=3162724 RepID=UPI0032F10276|nr:filamentous hemagglutinin N-terminal domain-containing protein [Thiotrichaceae bacterium]
MHDSRRFLIYLIGLLSFFSVQADVVTDGSVGQVVSLQGQMQIKPEYGQQQDTNLFHSFSRFQIQAGETVQFLAAPQTQNIIARITGANYSLINGTLSAPTNLYLFNPQGFLFTEQAELNVQGDLHISTAQQLTFSDNTQYNTDLSQTTLLTTALPEAFGLLNSTTQIAFKNSQILHNQSIFLAASHIQLQDSVIRTQQGGDLRLIADTMTLENSQLSTDMLTRGQGGSIQLTATDSIQLSNSIISSSLGDLFNTGIGSGGQIMIETPHLLLQQRSGLQTGAFPNTEGQAGDIIVNVKYLSLKDLSSMTSFSSSGAQGGNIQIQAEDIDLNNSLITASSLREGTAGNLQLDTHNLTLHQTSILSTSALQSGGGNISLNIQQQFLSLQSAITAKAEGQQATHNGGNVTIQSPQLTVFDQTEIFASAYAGHGGDIVLQTDYLLTSPNYLLDASSQLGLAGEIWINSFEVDMSKAFYSLPRDYLQTGNLLKQRCAAKFNLDISSLTVKNYEVLPPMPIGIQ